MSSKDLLGSLLKHFLTVVGSVAGAILSFLGKTAGFAIEHTWDLIAIVAGLVGVCLMQKVQNLKKS